MGVCLDARSAAKGDTALHLAVWSGHLLAVQWLVRRGADMHATDNQGQNAAHIAARRGELEVLRWLFGEGLDVHLQDARGATPRMQAQQDDPEVRGGGLRRAPRWTHRAGSSVTAR